MADIYRLIARSVLPLFVLLFSTVSHAAFPSTTEQVWQAGTYTGSRVYVCEMWAKYERPTEYHGVLQPDGNCHVLNEVNRFIRSFYPSLKGTQQACPSNATLGGSSCTCNTGYLEQAGSCVAAPPVNNCKSGASAGRYQYPQAAGRSISAPYYICDGDTPSGNSDGSVCVVRVDGSMAAGGVVYGDAYFTGAKKKMTDCTGGGGAGNTGDSPTTGNSKPPVQGEPSPTSCKAGEAPGSVNGITKCYPAGATGQPVTTSEDKETTTTPPAGGASAPTAPNDAGNIGAPQCVGSQCTTKTKTETTCVGSTCTTSATTTTTTTNADGSTTTKTGTSTTTGSKDGYCKENPKSQQCSSGSFGGTCSAGFTCDGDAVMCSIAKEIHQRNCKLFDLEGTDAVKALNAALAAAPDMDKAGAAQGPSEEVGLENSIKKTNALGVGASCITDKTVTVMSASVTIPMSRVCPYLEILGNALVAIGMIAAAVIVFRG